MPLPHLPWPFRLGVTVEQGTFEQRQADTAVVVSTVRGDRPDVPQFGVTLPIFEPVPVDVSRLADEIAESDLRLAAEVEDLTALATATVAELRVDLTTKGRDA